MIRGFFDALNSLVLVHVGGEALHFQFARLSGILALRVGTMARQLALDESIAFVSRSLAGAALYCACEFEPRAVYGLGGERKRVPIQRGLAEELIEESLLIGLVVAETRNEARDISALFLVDLNELAVF